jgi:DNA adenine methylase
MQQQTTPAVRTAKPFLKWAGGKQQLLAQMAPLLPADFRRYHEPFLGSGALYFHLWNAGRITAPASLTDNNAELIATYAAVRDDVDGLIDRLQEHAASHGREHYYAVRAQDRGPQPLTPMEQAARLIYLNRTCYNGLYRVNRDGFFNTPLGSYTAPRIVQAATLRAASAALMDAELRVAAFDAILDRAQPGDFVYCDPPYDPVSRTASFTSYTRHSFGEPEQRRLAAVFTELARRGCSCMLSNSYTPLILDLYRGFDIKIVQATRAINSKGDARGVVREVVVCNYQ